VSLLTVQNLSKRFGGLQAVDDVSFSVEEDQIFGIIGPNGAGKSTIFNLVTANLPRDSGTVILDGKDVSRYKTHQIVLAGMGRTFQDAKLFASSTVLDNVLSAGFCRLAGNFASIVLKSYARPSILDREKEKAMELLEFVGLKGYEFQLARNMDHGHQGLLQLGISMATQPKVLMLDEPLRGMNPTEKDIVTDLILKIRDTGIAVVIIEHDVRSIMKVCDQIAVVNYGKKIAEGDPRQIRDNPEVIEAYLGAEEVA